MLLLYITVCYLSILQSTSYVLLAANIDDFKSLAKRFAPEHLSEDLLKKRDSTDVEETEEKKGEESGAEATPKTLLQGVEKVYFKNTKDSNRPVYEVDLDDLVERVKEKLRKELTSIVQHEQNTKKTHTNDPHKENNDDYEATQPALKRKPQIRYIKQKRHDSDENSEKERPAKQDRDKDYDNRDSNQHHQSKYIEKPKTKHERYQRLTRDTTIKENRHRVTKKLQTRPTEVTNEMFAGIDMAKTNDSYEDYVTPKKDENYEEPELPKYNREVEAKPPITDATVRDSYKHKPDDSDEETTNDNKKRLKRVKNKHESKDTRDSPAILQLSLSTKPEDRPADPILSYAQQIVAQVSQTEEYADEYTTSKPEEILAMTEKLHDDGDKHSNPNFNNKYGNKNKKIGHKGTVIPKRDFYKLSSPNYLAKIPVVAEKYKFDEPLPEKDREPELLKNVGNPPASINGKVILL